MTLRLARPEDAPAIAAGEWETARTPGRLVGHPGEIPLQAYEAKIRDLADRGRYVVAEEGGKIVGHAFLDPLGMRATAHVFSLTIVVHPGHTGRGLGRAMMDDLLAWAQADPRVGKVELHVRAGNERAIRLYKNCGFVEEGRFKRRVRLPDGSDIDDIAMAWFPTRDGAVSPG